jgi:hypothetical protein
MQVLLEDRSRQKHERNEKREADREQCSHPSALDTEHHSFVLSVVSPIVIRLMTTYRVFFAALPVTVRSKLSKSNAATRAVRNSSIRQRYRGSCKRPCEHPERVCEGRSCFRASGRGGS